MELSGWGRYPRLDAQLLVPTGAAEVPACLQQVQTGTLIGRGAGRSYGDSALAPTVLSSRYLDHFFEFDRQQLSLHCAAGLQLGEILDVIVPHGAFLPVLPGTQSVTIGGAIAADIHGKNHHVDGSFCDHVSDLTLVLAGGETRRCSRQQNPELFAATCGGMGLTGIIVEARLKLKPISSPLINNRTLSADNLQHCLELLRNNADHQYVVAWIDCLARGTQLGRAIVYLGEHVSETGGDLEASGRPLTFNIPFATPAFLLNRYTMRSFNALYHGLQTRRPAQRPVHYQQYFFPLDRLGHWNRLYGRRGFLQYQLLLPEESAAAGLEQILSRVAAAGQGSFLSVLKQFGAGNNNHLSFPRAGFTLTLDFKYSSRVLALLDELDKIVLQHGGRLYLAKDARMSAAMFQAGYPRWQEFLKIKQAVDPGQRFASLQSQRLGLTPGNNLRTDDP